MAARGARADVTFFTGDSRVPLWRAAWPHTAQVRRGHTGVIRLPQHWEPAACFSCSALAKTRQRRTCGCERSMAGAQRPSVATAVPSRPGQPASRRARPPTFRTTHPDPPATLAHNKKHDAFLGACPRCPLSHLPPCRCSPPSKSLKPPSFLTLTAVPKAECQQRGSHPGTCRAEHPSISSPCRRATRQQHPAPKAGPSTHLQHLSLVTGLRR